MPRMTFSDAPHFQVNARIRGNWSKGWVLQCGKQRYRIAADGKMHETAARFTISTEWQSCELTRRISRSTSGHLFDGTPLVYRACAPYWRGDDLIAPHMLECFVGELRFTAEKAQGTERVSVRDERGDLMLEARVPWQDSEAGVAWVIDLHYTLDDPNVQLALLLFPWATSVVYTWWEYEAKRSATY